MEKEDVYNVAVSFRRHLHRYPEVSAQEFKTQAYIVEVLEQHEIPCQTFGTGVIAVLGKGERCVALRADIDAAGGGRYRFTF